MSFFREHVQKPIIDVIRKKRSSKWRTVRKEYIKTHPTCEACGRKKKVEVHHIEPFHEHPEMELDHRNLIALCSHATECHFSIGHLGSFHSYNPNVETDAIIFLDKVKNRP